jgi:hypothetical protein
MVVVRATAGVSAVGGSSGHGDSEPGDGSFARSRCMHEIEGGEKRQRGGWGEITKEE